LNNQSSAKNMRNYYTLIALLLPVAFVLTTAQAETASKTNTDGDGYAIATFAGGCFWCMEHLYDELDGVISTTSGYTGGSTKNPTYEQVSTGTTGHTEAVQVKYDPSKITYQKLLVAFWRNIDPTISDRQFCDKGSQYRAGIFYHDAEQQSLAEASKRKIERTKKFREPVVTEITQVAEFYPAETYHQDYYLKNPLRYKLYRHGCGRDKRLEQLWGQTG
jgi:peptide-methionine (S)-S-oxide reductase